MLSEKNLELAELMQSLFSGLSKLQKYQLDRAIDVGFLMDLTGEDEESNFGSPLLSLKLAGLADMARTLDTIKSSKTNEIIQSFRVMEMPNDHKKLELYSKASPRS